ncbi:hypothetical protein C8N46_102563 [Kordia periserrulae]|uniref:Uncharacterized protein n=1 Tax=Kordia periserrulae TaxID=701523 RepID=A0A2T6C4A5_9FLAO|nr:hypothetical protein C8N46_102563 [Kordia periserrulae]
MGGEFRYNQLRCCYLNTFFEPNLLCNTSAQLLVTAILYFILFMFVNLGSTNTVYHYSFYRIQNYNEICF